MLKGFKNFLMHGDIVVVAIGLAVALAFSTLVKAFTDAVVTPLVNAAGGGGENGLGVRVNGQLIDFGALISAFVYFVVFMAVIYFAIVVPYRAYMARRGRSVFGDPPPTKTCGFCLSKDLAPAATRCPHCTSELSAEAA